jgi:hypothetical protein
MRGDRLTLIADGKQAWKGSVGRTVNEFDGPADFCSDYARFGLEYMTAGNT